MTERYGWICPKCGRVYSPDFINCKLCNVGITTKPPKLGTCDCALHVSKSCDICDGNHQNRWDCEKEQKELERGFEVANPDQERHDHG